MIDGLNPRYVAYAKSHGKTPQEMLEFDKQKYSGGCMAGFIIWIHRRCSEFKKISPELFCGDEIGDQDRFTAFLEKFAENDTIRTEVQM